MVLKARQRTASVFVVMLLTAACAACSPTTPTDPNDSRTPPVPTGPVTSATGSSPPLTKQEIIRENKSLTLRLETTSCTGYDSGSGFVVGPNLVATVASVVAGVQTISVRGSNGVSTGSVVGIDTDRQVALIRTAQDLSGGKMLRLTTDQPVQGDEVVTIGNPRGRQQTPIAGTIGAVDRTEDADGKRLTGLLQLVADTSPDSTGGPVIDVHGQVVGLTDARISDENGGDFAISAKVAGPLIDAWAQSPAVIDPPSCASVPKSAVSSRSDHPDAPGIAVTLRAYFDGINDGDREYAPESDAGNPIGFDVAFDALSGKLKSRLGPDDRFREDRLNVTARKVALETVVLSNEVTDTADVSFTMITKRAGPDKCIYYHYRYQVRLASGVWKLDDRIDLANNATSC